jgi:5-methylcytosine-specific restriction protein A
MAPTARDFQIALEREFADAQQAGRASVEINAGTLHRQIGAYPGRDHRMPVCCRVMRSRLRAGLDEIVDSPPSGQGASLTIRYRLPRP